jgi:taurine dioxygenase
MDFGNDGIGGAAVYKKIDKGNKKLSRANRMGAVAAIREPDAEDRASAALGIRDQDAGLLPGTDLPTTYSVANICGRDFKLEPLTPSIGTVVHGIDLDQHLQEPAVVDFLRGLWLKRKVIMFRGQQHLTKDGLIQMAEHFGELGAHHGERDHIPSGLPTPEDYPDVLSLISNEKYPSAASEWHSDATWSSRPPMGSILICREAPPIGGDTNFCDCYGLWAALHPETQARVKTLSALHEGQPHHKMDGKLPTAIHPVARTHPETGGTALFVNRVFTQRFCGNDDLDEVETANLLDELLINVGRAEFTCRFRWAPGSVAMWDNRAVQHCATADFWPHRRVMERVTILDYDLSRRAPFFQN